MFRTHYLDWKCAYFRSTRAVGYPLISHSSRQTAILALATGLPQLLSVWFSLYFRLFVLFMIYADIRLFPFWSRVSLYVHVIHVMNQLLLKKRELVIKSGKEKSLQPLTLMAPATVLFPYQTCLHTRGYALSKCPSGKDVLPYSEVTQCHSVAKEPKSLIFVNLCFL